MGDSWEDEDSPTQQPPRPGLNPMAPSFTFNPGARSFVPTQNVAVAASQSEQHSAQADASETAYDAATIQGGGANTHDVDMLDAHEPGVSSKDVEMEPATAANGPEAGSQASVHSTTAQLNGLALSDSQPPPSPAPDEKPVARKAPEPEDDEDLEPEEQRNLELQRIAEELAKEDGREHMNIVFIGHVDAGKSTTGGQILFLTGGVDKRTIEKYEKEAKDKNRESWYMAYIMDTNEEERAKGKTVEILVSLSLQQERASSRQASSEAVRHENMLSLLATLGVAKLIVAVNKMDDPSVAGPNGEWSKERYDEIVEKLTPILEVMRNKVDPKRCPWYKGGSLFDVLDGVEPLPRDPLAPFRMSVIDKYKDMGTIAMGKSESGIIRKGDKLFVMPNKVSVQVITIYRDDDEVNAANCGENLRLRLTGIDEDELQAGFVICSRHKPVPCVTYFDAQLQILDLLEHKAIFYGWLQSHPAPSQPGRGTAAAAAAAVAAGAAAAVVATSSSSSSSTFGVFVSDFQLFGMQAKFVKSASVVICRIAVEKPICAELFSVVPQLGRFTLRDEGRTIAIGKIVKLPKSLRQGTEDK
eukprot:jgi/Botrbrau1/14162/Bobra.182_3s0102.1